MKYLATITLAIASTLTATQANWFTQMFESDSDRIVREFREKQTQERADQEWMAFVGREHQIRMNATRRLYGDGNPEHLEALSEQLDADYLQAYRNAYYPNR
jgi:hypothetical protein